ncbi:PREDICTED: protein SZT2 isoform X1 [Crocodylus porosus]|uniref:protein SZT2 isoform X1 n=1 Tax=Crocodylus porosus TaxID=8502 RepID=UPI00093D2656|nr:PREDICTED: protein SZT2 isoform X1 [Crocodylus porosus]
MAAPERPDCEMEEAAHAYLLMRKDYRISRNVRLAWFLARLHQPVCAAPDPGLVPADEELAVLSVLPHSWQPDEPLRPRPCLLVPSTRVTFLARRYRFVIELDLSPSTGIVDDSTGEIIFDEVFHALSRCLVGLLRPFQIPGSDIIYQPEIFVTIQAYSSIIGLQSHQVLFQGCQLDESKRDAFLQQVYTQLCTFENKVAEMLQQQYEPKPQVDLSSLNQDSPCDPQDPPGRKPGVSVVTADVGLVSMIRQGILALQLLPSNSTAGIIVITDGVTSVPDVAVCETLLNQLRSGTVACSFVQVGGVYSYDCSFGHVPNVELMKFIAMATFGSYLSTCPELDPVSLDLNVYHKAFLLYSFLRTGESLNLEYYCVSQHRLFNEHLVSASSNPALAMRRKKHTEKEVHADLVSIVSVRLREGYSIREVNITKGGSQLEVKLVLLWKHNMRIEYLAVAPWPLDPSKRSTWVEVTMEGSYDILHDISCTMRKPITSLYRTTVIRRFWNTLQSINQTDQMLVHLQSFDTIPEHFTIPESTKNGVPLFYIPPGSTTPVLSLQHSGSDSSHSQFASYWKPILSMDANFWQRWLHMHRIVLLLEHDTPVPKHLHTPGNNGRYSTIQCRISHSALTSLLRDWSSFVLVEGYSYVKLIHSSEDPTPSSFYVVRIISKAPCMVLRLGFPIGTPAQARNKIVEELRDRILQLRFPHRVQSKEATPKAKRKSFGSSSPSKSPPVAGAQPAFSDRPCLVVLHKPLEKLLIRYEKLPSDYRAPFSLTLEHPPVSGPLTMASRTASSTLASLSRYFYHQRWIWSVQSGLAPAVPITAVAQLLSTLTELRLSEGFHFASSGDGIINMALELPIQINDSSENGKEKHTCIVQYLLFPPHSTSTKDSFSTDDDNDTEVEAIEVDTELNLVTECWVEPQSGHVHSTAENWRHLQGLPYQKIPKALYPRDLACISTLLTFEYVSQLCQNKDWVCPVSDTRATEDADVGASSRVHEIPFQFSLLKLLPRCQQIEMFFLMLTREDDRAAKDPMFMPNEMLLSLFHGCLEHDLSDREVPLASADHMAFMEQVLQRDRDGHLPPFTLPSIQEETLKAPAPLEGQDTSMSFHPAGGSSSTKDGTGSTSTLQSLGNMELPEDVAAQADTVGLLPLQWRCYAKLINLQHLFLTFLPATFADVQKLVACGLEKPPKEEACPEEADALPSSPQEDSRAGADAAAPLPTLSVTPAHEAGQDPSEPGAVPRRDVHISFSRQASQPDPSECRRIRCPVYVYSCSLEALREQLVSPRAHRPPHDIFFRSQSLDRPPSASWLDHKHKELVGYCTLLQEHSHQCYVKGLFKSLQQSHGISSQDLLTAMDYCEELLQEIDITHFLLTLCSHVRSFRESHQHFRTHTKATGFHSSLGSAEQDNELGARKRGILASESSAEMEDYSEQDSHHISSPTEELRGSTGASCCPDFPLSLLGSSQPCQMHPDLHKIIQEKFLEIGSLHFKPVPSNPHYFFYCPPSAKKEEDATQDLADRKGSEDLEGSEPDLAAEEGTISGCCIATESDPELEVEYREKLEHEFLDTDSQSGSNTVNQDDDSFSILGGDSLNEQELPEQEMPPLFMHLTCSVKLRSQHSSMPVRSLPTCLGEVLSCLESCQAMYSIDLADLCVTLDIFVLTLPLEIDVVNADIQHNRCTSESSVSFTRSPGQPSSFRSDDEIMPSLDRLPSTGDERHPALSNLPGVHREAVEATMNEIRWLLDDEIVSALRHSQDISADVLHRVATHIHHSQGRPSCHSEAVLLQFVFGPEHSLEKFREEFRRMTLPGYVLNAEGSDYHYISISRLHAQRAGLGPQDPPECAASALHGGGPEGAQSQAGLESGTKAEGPALQYPPCTRPEEPRGIWPWPTNETCIRADVGSLPDKGSHAQSEVPVVEEAPRPAQGKALGWGSLEEVALETAPRSLPSSASDKWNSEKSPLATPSAASLAESTTHGREGSSKQQPSRVQSLVSSQGSMDSDHLGYDGGSSDSECEEALMSDQDPQCPLMPDFWLIVKIHQDRVEVYSHTRSLSAEKAAVAEAEEEPAGTCLRLHQAVVRKISEICRVVNQRLLLQDLHDSHICNSLLVAESEEDIWKSETPYTSYRQRVLPTDDYAAEESYQPRDYLAATMQFVPGHFACDVVWSTIIHVHSRLKMGPNMGVSRAIQALRSVLNAFSVVNRKNMFVYQERSTKAVFYLRLTETTYSGKIWEGESTQGPMCRSLALTRSQEPIYPEDLMGSRSSFDLGSCRSVDSTRPVGQVDRHIQLMVHGVTQAGPEITDELVKVLRRRLDEATLDIITVMLVRNCKLTPADVEFIQPPGTPPTEVLQFTLPPSSLPWLPAMAYYLRQNLLIFLHTPKYTDSNVEHHFKHYFHPSGSLPDLDLYLYNKPGGQGTGGKGIACIALTFVDENDSPLLLAPGDRPGSLRPLPSTDLLQDSDFESLTTVSQHHVEPGMLQPGPCARVRLDVWEKGNISLLQLSEKLRGALRHALCDATMEVRVLPAPLCMESACPLATAELDELTSGGGLRRTMSETKGLAQAARNAGASRGCPAPLHFTPAAASSPGEPVTPTSKLGRRSFWDMLSKAESSELGSPKTTDDIVLERPEETRTRRRHKTESVRQHLSQERATATAELEQAQRRRTCQLEEGDVGVMHPLFHQTCQQWMAFMSRLGCPSVQQCSVEIVSRFLLPSVLAEVVSLVTALASDTTVKVFERLCCPWGATFLPYKPSQSTSLRPAAVRHFILLGRSFHQWRYSTEQVASSAEEQQVPPAHRFKPHKGLQRFEAMEFSSTEKGLGSSPSGRDLVPRQRFLLIEIIDKKLTLYTYNWSPDLGSSLASSLMRLLQWQNARSHVVHCLLSQKLGLFHHYCYMDTPWHEDAKQEPNPFLNTLEVDMLIRNPSPPPSREQGRLSSSGRSLPSLHFPPDMVPFDEALRDVTAVKCLPHGPEVGLLDPVSRHGAQFLEIKSMERRELEKQMKIENLFVTWQQRSAQSNMPISLADLETLKQSSRLVHYCATPLLFDPAFRQQIQADQQTKVEGKKRHRSNDSTASGRDRSHSCDSTEALPCKLKEEPWLLEMCGAFLQQYIQYLQSMGFILVQVRPPSPTRSTSRIRALAALGTEGRGSFSYKPKADGSPKSTSPPVTTYHLQRALPGGIVLMELAFQGYYFCVKQYALECSRIPMGQTVNSQGALTARARSQSCMGPGSVSECALSMLFTEECDKVRDLMHVHSFSYDFHLRVVHQYLLGSHMALRQGYHLTSFLQDFIAHHPDIPKFGRNHVFQGMLALPTNMITAHQLYNYVADHANTYHMKPLRMARTAGGSDGKKGPPGTEQNEYALVSIWNSSGSYKDSEGLRHHDDFDVSLLVCHSAAPFEEQSEAERHVLRLCFYVVMTSQRELFPRLTADMRRFKKLPHLQRDMLEPVVGRAPGEAPGPGLERQEPAEREPWQEAEDGGEFYAGGSPVKLGPGLFYTSPLFPLLASEVASAQQQLSSLVQLAKCHCRRDNLWKRLFLLEPLASDKLKLGKLSLTELEELLNAVHRKSIADIDPQLGCFLTMTASWYQSLIKVLLSRFPQSCRHFHNAETGTQYLVVLNQKFTDCFILIFLDSHSGKTSLTVVFREPFPVQPQDSESPLPQLVSTYHHLESVINTACFNVWTGLL